MEVISSIENKKIKDLKKLREKKNRDKTKTFIVEGMHLVLEAYKSGNLVEVFLEENEVLPISVPISYVTYDVIKNISELETPYKVIGLCSFSEENEEIGDRVLLLDNVQDPGNIGTIIRSAVAFNVDTVVLGDGCADIYNSKVLRGCQGMNFHINILRRNLKEFILELKKNEFKIYATNVENGIEIKDIKNLSKYAIIMGNEGNGVSKELNELCDQNLYIKMNEVCESLNVGVATSIILYELDS